MPMIASVNPRDAPYGPYASYASGGSGSAPRPTMDLPKPRVMDGDADDVEQRRGPGAPQQC